jgi:outer membrane lipoprotein LolB
MRLSRPLGSTVLVLLLTACAAHQPPAPRDSNWSARQASLAQFDTWTASGKLALRTPELSESVSMEWRQQGDATRLLLSGPLGVNATTIEKEGDTLSISQGDDRRALDLSDPLALERATGWNLPLGALPYWLKGLPAPELAVQDLELASDNPALLQTLRQDDWEIRYEQYADFDQRTLPVRLHIQQGTTSVRVIVRAWETGEAQ